jgi:methyltransferase of FxLD system
MARTASEQQRRTLTAALRAQGTLSCARVEQAFHAVAREQFLPETLAAGGLDAVYRDEAIVTKRGAQGWPLSSSSQPAIMAKMLELLDVQPGDRVLEIGAGTGYNAALLAHLTGPSGRVTSIDIDADVAHSAQRALRDAGARATIVACDGREGYAPHAPYDRIVVTASADEIPTTWVEQLREAGRIVLPLRLDPERGALQLIPALERQGTTLRSVGLTWGGFMPLHDGDGGHQPPSANLSAVHTTRDQAVGLASLTGHGIGHLSQAAARELLASLLRAPDEPRRRGITSLNTKRPPLLLLYLQLTIPANRRLFLHEPGRWGIGLVDRRSQSAAIVSLRSPWSTKGDTPQGRARWRLDAYGTHDAAAELEDLLTHWQQLEHAGHTTLRITGHRRGHRLHLSFAWTENHRKNPSEPCAAAQSPSRTSD